MAKCIKVDLKDRKILHELDWDARLSNAEIGRRVGLSKKGVEYRIKKLEESGLIEGYYPVIDFIKLGYSSKRFMIRFKHISPKIKEEIEKYIINNENFGWVVWFTGEYDFGASTRTKNFLIYLREVKKFLVKFGKYIDTKEFEDSIGMREYPLKFLLNKKTTKKIVLGSSNYKIYNIDKSEDKILKALLENARSSITKIGKKVNLNNRIVSKKIKSLYKNGIIAATRAKINTGLLGTNWYKVFIYTDVNSQSSIDQLEKYIEEQIETSYIVNLVGKADIDFEMHASYNKFVEFMNKLLCKFSNIIDKYSHVTLDKTIKIKYIPS